MEERGVRVCAYICVRRDGGMIGDGAILTLRLRLHRSRRRTR